jgi:hypothetical protein
VGLTVSVGDGIEVGIWVSVKVGFAVKLKDIAGVHFSNSVHVVSVLQKSSSNIRSPQYLAILQLFASSSEADSSVT